jgi:tRNA (cmo5U34)-methyltransferase
MSEFDLKATEWDKNIVNIERAHEIANQILLAIPFKAGMKVMEFGAGTGLLSFMLEDLFASVTLIDTSAEMIRICNEKIAQNKSSHIKALKIDLETEYFDEKFDLIYTQMALHHISDISGIIYKFKHLLNYKGILAIADLYTEDGSFHGEGFTGHLGFDPELLSGLLNQSGFEDSTFKECFVQKKVDTDGQQKAYPVFLLVANKISV